MLKIEFYVPKKYCEEVKQASFVSGAGRTNDGLYDNCAWQTIGAGQFRPLQGSQPAIGEQGIEENVEEYKVEMVLQDVCLEAVIAALNKTRLYEKAGLFYLGVL